MLNAFEENAKAKNGSRTFTSYAVSIAVYGALAATVLASTGRAVMRMQEEERTVLVRSPEPITPPPPPPTPAPAAETSSAPRRLGRAATVAPTSIPTTTPTPSAPVAAAPAVPNDLPVGDPFGDEHGSATGTGRGAVAAAPAARESGGGPVRLPESAERPVALSQVEPDFPDSVRGSGATSVRITARITLDANGNVSRVEILRGFPDVADSVFVRAISQWHFRPARVGGENIAVHFIQPITFRLTM